MTKNILKNELLEKESSLVALSNAKCSPNIACDTQFIAFYLLTNALKSRLS